MIKNILKTAVKTFIVCFVIFTLLNLLFNKFCVNPLNIYGILDFNWRLALIFAISWTIGKEWLKKEGMIDD